MSIVKIPYIGFSLTKFENHSKIEVECDFAGLSTRPSFVPMLSHKPDLPSDLNFTVIYQNSRKF